jgi:hypothetical protein
MIRTRTWVIAGVLLGGALVAGAILAQTPPTTSNAAGAASGDQPAPRVYNPVQPETLGIASSAQQLFGSFVKAPDSFYGEVGGFPDGAARAGFTAQNYFAFRTRPDGSNLICFVPRMVKVAGSDTPVENPDLQMLLEARPVRGTEIYLMGQVGPRMFVGDGGATAFAVDRVVLGHEEPKAPKSTEKKPVVLTIERFGPTGNLLKREYQIPEPGIRYKIPDPVNPDDPRKDIYITLQF